jgi:hypothetical protein
MICLLERVGLARNVRRPSEREVARKLPGAAPEAGTAAQAATRAAA